MYSIPKMRTIKEIAAIVKNEDPDTKLTEKAIRHLASSGKLPSVRVGSKYLISLETFEDFLRKGTENTKENASPCPGIIKPVKV